MYLAYKKDNLNKILFILLVGFFMLLIFASSSFADSEVSLTYNGDTRNITIPDCYATQNGTIFFAFGQNLEGISGSSALDFVVATSDLICSSGSDGSLSFSCPDGFLFWGGYRFYANSSDGYFSSVQSKINDLCNNVFNEEYFSRLHYKEDTIPSSIANFIVSSFSSKAIKDNNGNLVFGSLPFNAPYFMTVKENLETGKFDTVDINAGDLDGTNDKFGLFIYDITSSHFDSIFSSISDLAKDVTPVSYMILDGSSPYRIMMDTDAIYSIPREKLGINLQNGKRYQFALINADDGSAYNRINFSVGGLTAEEELKNKQDETNKKIEDQTEAIKESDKTNKNIFERIGEMLSYINPFSENFFVYKLIELLVNAIKSLFIPSDDFFSNYFTDLKDWFSERLGFLFYPFQLIIDILNKILNINFSEPVFNIPDLIEPFTGNKIMSATTFNLNSMIEGGVFKTIHGIYLVCVDAFITFELVNLFKRKYEEVTTK